MSTISRRNALMILSTFTCIVCMAVNPGVEAAGGPKDSTLYSTVYRQDSLLFAAFNSGNFELFKRFFSGELQIYQDNIGVRNYDESVAAFEGLFTGNYKLTRTLLKETLEVYPIKNFGAIETGQHTFCHPENGKPDCGTYKFVHIWTNQKGTWKIVKIITYNH